MTADPLTIRIVALPPFIDLGATVLFSITGATVAIRRHYDFIGVFVLALACGLGGGLLRDGIFIQNGPPVAMREGSYIIAVLVGCIAAAFFHKQVDLLSKPFLIFDALGSGAYGVVGVTWAGACLTVRRRDPRQGGGRPELGRNVSRPRGGCHRILAVAHYAGESRGETQTPAGQSDSVFVSALVVFRRTALAHRLVVG